MDIFGRLQGIAIGCELHTHAHPGCAVQPGRGGIGLAAQLDAGHVFEAHRRAIGVGPQGDVAKLLNRAELAIDHHGGGNALPGEVGQIANGTAGHLGVLGADGGIDIGWGQGKAGQLDGIDPDAHGPLGAKQLHLPNARNTLQLRLNIARGVVTQGGRVDVRVGRRQNGKEQKVGARLVHPHPLLGHHRGQAWRSAGQAVLYIHLRQVGIGAGLKTDRHRAGAIGLGHRLHVNHAGRAVHLALNHRQHAVLQRLGRGPRISGANHHAGRGHRRVLGNRKLLDGHQAQNADEQCQHPGKNGAVNKKSCHVALDLLRCSSSRWRRSGPRRLPGHGFDGGARWQHLQLLETIDHHLLARLQAPIHQPAIAVGVAHLHFAW